jgi:prepilin-type N-terminal cleavage/methylation domain-containing protein
MLRRTKSRMRVPGFTLVELVAVMGVMAALAAILLPVLTQARLTAAHRYTSGENLGKIGRAVLQYVQDNDGRFPRGGYSCRNHDTMGDATVFAAGEGNQCGGDDWQDVVGPYVKDPRLFVDSADISAPGAGPWGSGFPAGRDFSASDGNFSFLYNDLLAHKMPTTTNGYADLINEDPHSNGLALSAVRTPADCLLVVEGHGGWDRVDMPGARPVVADWTASSDLHNKWHHDYTLSNNSFLITSTAYDGSQYIREDLPYHKKGGNVFFTDGHEKFIVFQTDTGKPRLCRSLPWPKHIDPQQRNGERDSCKDSKNPLPAGWGRPNWY